jgi:rhomboid protease GluP
MADKRRMCPHCRAFITTGDRVCPYCGADVGPRAIDVRNPGAILGGLIPASKFTTSLILLLNIGIYIASQFNQNLELLGWKDSRAILEGHQYWRLITAGFLHGSILHIAMNMWVLNDLGAEVERTYGTARFLIIYFAGTVFGFLLSAYLSPAPSLGASAGLFGLIGAMIAFGLRNRTEVGRQIRGFYVKWAIYGMALGFLPGFHIDNYAHLGGLAAGLAIAYVAGSPVHASKTTEQVWKALAAICVILTAYSFWIVLRQVNAPQQEESGGAVVQLRAPRSSEAEAQRQTAASEIGAKHAFSLATRRKG